jgi:hypothetical protein
MKQLVLVATLGLFCANAPLASLRADSLSIGVDLQGSGEHHHLSAREEARLRKEHRAYDRRLNRVQARIDRAEREGRVNAEEARRHREEIAATRARYRDNDDHSPRELNSADRSSVEVDVRGHEGMVFQHEKR